MLSFKLAGRSFLGEILALRQWLQQQQQWSVVAWALWVWTRDLEERGKPVDQVA